jgi:hypothetical protein
MYTCLGWIVWINSGKVYGMDCCMECVDSTTMMSFIREYMK